MKDFFKKHYEKINIARLIHLKSLNLNFDNVEIVELGAGAGFFSKKLNKHNIKSLDITDGREECVTYLRKTFINHNVYKIDLNTLNKINKRYDICFAYGVLYHVDNLDNALSNIDLLTKNFCIIETVVKHDIESDDEFEIVNENIDTASQSITGKAVRFKREFLIKKLSEKFDYVYISKKQPNHDQFPTNWSVKKDGISRFVVIASRHKILSDKLCEVLPMYQKQLNIFEIIYNFFK